MDKSKLKQKLRRLCLDIKNSAPKYLEYDISRITLDYLKEHNIQRAVIGLNTKGCSYAKKTGGCFICGYLPSSTKRRDTVKQFLKDLEKYRGASTIYVYSNGSFLDEEEICKEEQNIILESLAGFPTVRRIVFETRPEFIEERKIKEILKVSRNKTLEIRVGFDTYDDEIRGLCLGKGFTRKDYDKATEILRSQNIMFGTYVVVKPPFLTESEGIKEAQKTAIYAFERGSSFVSLEPVAIQEYTLQKYLKEKELYRVPWLWSVIEVVKATYGFGKIIIGGDSFIPLPTEIAHNCNKCTKQVRERINDYNLDGDISVFNELNCDCIEDWKRDLDKKEKSLYERIMEIF